MRFSLNAAKVLDQAGHEYNYGLRAYYFALAYLCWFVSPWLFITASIIVTAVLYRREYKLARPPCIIGVARARTGS